MVDHAVYRPQDDGQSFVHKDEDDRDLGKVLSVGQLLTPGHKTDISVSVCRFIVRTFNKFTLFQKITTQHNHFCSILFRFYCV